MGVMLDAPWTGAVFTPPTAIDIATIEDAIVNQLRSQISSIEIAHYPDNPETWRMTHRVGAALVMYKGAQYGELLDTAAIIQERKLEFEIAVMMRDLGWAVGGDPLGPSPGAYGIIEGIRTALTGYQIAGCRKLYPVREKFIKRDKQGGVWTYASTFALSTVAVEASQPDDFPLFVKGVALEEGGQTSITLGAVAYTFNSSLQVQLPNGNVFAVSITGPGGAALTEGTDFTVDRANGTVTAIPGGAISAGETVQIAYVYAEVAIARTGQSEPTN
ncbi:MAG TPA: Gp37 family protein [Candidatus Binatus sp.]|uniref:Gp37 family protein n=1 Tax=Candidatus Binatus sp. TaxID=2811406 RepID=UPI002B463ED5|nr:Gp37 family protein [Candidatus Binatus sp.]HKN15009.1 Gp37 family protein [Candidatus Binatus sp.]